MKILEIYAEDFGCLADRRFALGEGFNLIEGPNESGKSTLLALLRFLFYGFPRRNGPDGEERDKRLSWRWRRASGSVTLSVGDRIYTVTRSYGVRSAAGREAPFEELSVMARDTGKEVALEGKTPGEYFLGLPAELYDSSLCIGQSDIARVGDPNTGEAVSTLLFSEGSSFDSEEASKILQNARRELQHLKGRGGRIAELEDRLVQLDEELSTAAGDTERLHRLRADLARHTAQVAERRRQLSAVNAALSVADLDRKLAGYDEWHKAAEKEALCKQQLDQAQASLEAIKAPDAGFFDRVRDLVHKHARVEDDVRHAEEQVASLQTVTFNDALIEGHMRAEEMGGLDGIHEKMQKQQQQKGTFIVAAITSLLVAAVLLVGAFASPALFLPLFLVGLAVGVISLGLFYKGAKCMLGATLILRRLGVEDAALLRTYLEQCRAEDDAALAHRAKLFREEAQLTRATTECERLAASIREEFAAVGREKEYSDADSAERILSEISRNLNLAQQAWTEANLQYEKAKVITAALGTQLDPTAEHLLRAMRDKAEGSTDETPEALMRKRDFLAETVAGLDHKRAEAERAEAALAVVTKELAPLEAEHATVTRELKEARARLAAINMAIEALNEAGETLRSSVLPHIAEEASAIFSTLTDGAYKSLHLDERFAVTLDTPAGLQPISRFSAGCRDAAFLSLRLALIRVISPESLPLLMDETLSRLDDGRAKALVKLLMAHCKGGAQCLLFTCHTREAGFLARSKGVQRIAL